VLETGASSKVVYSYFGGQVSEKDEYDYGAASPTRKTIIDYQSFGVTPLTSFDAIVNRPCRTIVYDATDSPASETDYLYDGGTSVCGTPGTPSVTAANGLPSGTHDEDNYGSNSTAPRGNVTTITQKCFPNCVDSSTTYSYFSTGMLQQQTDAKNHSTTFEYDPAFAGAYVTKVTNALNQSTQMSYDFNSGLLTNVKDP
jgi:YD repeat-containing protein